MADLGLFSIGAGGLMSAYSQLQAGKAAADVADYNAQVLEYQAGVSRETAAYEEKRLRRAAERIKSTQRARYAKAGVTFEGSPLAVLADTAAEAEMDALAIRYAGETRAASYEMEAIGSRWEGKMAKMTGRIGAMQTILSTGGQVGYLYGVGQPKSTSYSQPYGQRQMGPGYGYGLGIRGAGYGYK